MSNSTLATYRKISSNRTSPRNHAIDTITIHYMAGNMTAKACADYFAKVSGVSSNYTIGSDGAIAVSVDESDRAWTSSNRTNDMRAVTIEVANTENATGKVTDKAYSALVDLCADICQRNGIDKLVWSDTKSDRVNHKNGCNMTIHSDFSASCCPGQYLRSKMPDIAEKVNAKLGAKAVSSSSSASTSQTSTLPTAVYDDGLYRIRKKWSDTSSQTGAYKNLSGAMKVCTSGYGVYDSNGKEVYRPDGLYRVRKTWEDANSQIGAFKNLTYAKNKAKQNIGYKVFNIHGEEC